MAVTTEITESVQVKIFLGNVNGGRVIYWTRQGPEGKEMRVVLSFQA